MSTRTGTRGGEEGIGPGLEGHVRPARGDELARLQAIEDAAGALFAEAGMPSVDAAEAMPLPRLDAARRRGHLFVLTDAADLAIGWAMLARVDGGLHLEELDVLPDYGRRGHGRRLLRFVLARAREEGSPQLTLTTYRDIPWNGPFYAREGFRPLAEAALGPELAAIRRRERDAGLDAAGPRIAMQHLFDGESEVPAGQARSHEDEPEAEDW